MKLKEISINHYRSFGENACLKFDSNVMALVGVNGIGKSNVLEAISRMVFFSDACENVILSNAGNQSTQSNPELHLKIEFSPDELLDMGKKLNCILVHSEAESIFEFTGRKTRMSFSGTFVEVMARQRELAEIAEDLRDISSTIQSRAGNSYTNREFTDFVEAMADYPRYYIPRLTGALEWVKSQLVPAYYNKESRGKVLEILNRFGRCINRVYSVFRSMAPRIQRFYDEAELADEYHVDDIVSGNRKAGGNRETALQRFLDAVGSNRDEVISALREGNSSCRRSIQDKIQRATRTLMKEFNQVFMHDQAEIELNVKFEGNTLGFTISEKDMPGSVLWSETSAGIRWYLGAFLELRKAVTSPNSIILLDEPGIHLHVNAQKEVFHFLYEMAEKTMCLIYTTHSPFMLDANKLGDIRAIVKEGATSAIRTLTGLSGTTCKKDVLAPICHAIGYDISANLTPNTAKTNLIVEGITDACYIGAMAEILFSDETKRPFILPGQGAISTSHLVSIMLGWGLDYKVVLDHDLAGGKTKAKMEKDFGKEVADRIFFVSDRDNESIENLVSKTDYALVCGTEYDAQDYKKDKRDKAYKFAGMVRSGELIPDEETRKNFLDLFVRLGFVEKPNSVPSSDNPVQEALS